MISLLDQIRVRIEIGQANDHPDEWLAVQPPVEPMMVNDVEEQLGFPLPELLRQLYTEIGNGGFGPTFGLIPLSKASLGETPPVEAEFDLLSHYHQLRHTFSNDSTGAWPIGLVPVFYCGCTVFEYVDCRQGTGRVIWFDSGTETPSVISSGERVFIESLESRLMSWLSAEFVW